MDNKTDMITLLIEDVALKCKKQQLIDHSNYFKVMFEGNFAERDKNIITLKDIEAKSMELIFNLLWDHNTGPAQLSDDELLLVLQTACMLQFEDIRGNCINTLTEKLNPDNCIKIWMVCESHGINPLFLKAKNLALIEFDHIRTTNALNDLDLPQLHSYLANVMLQCKSELDVFAVCMQWYYENGGDAAATLLRLLSCVDFASVSEQEMSEMMLLPDIHNNRLLTQVFTLISSLKKGENRPVRDEKLLVDIAENALKSTKRYQFNMDPILFVKKSLVDNVDGDGVVEEVQDVFKRKRKYIRLGMDNSKSAIYIYDIMKDRFMKCIDIPVEKNVGHQGFHILGYKEQIFLFGGEVTLGTGHWNLSFWMYDTIRERWERKTRLPSGRRHFFSCVCGPYIYIIGGIGSFRIIQDNMFSYNYDDNTWSRKIQLPSPSCQLRCCSFNDQLFLLNLSQRCGYIYLNAFIKYDIEDEGNLVKAYPPHFSLFTNNNRIYMKGTTLVEFELTGNKLCVRNVWPTTSNLAMLSDQMTSVVCNNTVFTLYKCTQTKCSQLEVMSLDDMRAITVRIMPPEVEEYSIDMATKIFTLHHHYKMMETDVYVNALTSISDDTLRSITNDTCDD